MKYLASGLLVLVTLALFLASFTAVVGGNAWWLRMTDFPRLQYLVALCLVLLVAAIATPLGGRVRIGVAVLALIAIGYNAVKLFPYFSPNDDTKVSCTADREFSVMVANVKKGNRSAGELIDLVQDRRPDLFLALETDEWWDTELGVLDDAMPHHAQQITGGFFGMHLFSSLPIDETEVIFPVEQDAPAILANVTLPSGGKVRFMGLHPRPPHPGQPSTGRDAQLMWAALRASQSDLPALIAGDLNAVPWEASIERLQRVGGFIDPRQRHGYSATYDVQSWWMSWPLDHVLYQPGLSVVSLEVLGDFGSDHYPIEVTLCHAPTDLTPPEMQDGDMEKAEQDIEVALESADERP